MPTHLAIDVNYIRGTLHFENAKVGRVDFYDSNGDPIAFNLEPSIQITLRNASAQPPFKDKPIKVGGLYVGFIIAFQNSFTGDVDWEAKQRA
jgi:hypothetical protein